MNDRDLRPLSIQLKKLCYLFGAVAAVFVIGIIGRAAYIHGLMPLHINEEKLTSAPGFWTYTDGTESKIVQLGGFVARTTEKSFTITTILEPEDRKLFGDTMLFYNDNLGIRVCLDGEEISEANMTKLQKGIIASGYVLFSLPDDEKDYEVSITFTHYSNGTCTVPIVYIGSRYAVSATIIKENLFAFFAIVFMLMAALVLIGSAIFFHIRKVKEFRFFALGIYLLISAVWTYTNSTLICMSPVSMEINALFSHISLMVLPVPVLFFVYYTCGRSHNAFRIAILVTIVNTCVQCVLSFFGVFTMNAMVVVTHLIIAGCLVTSLIVTIRESRIRKKDSTIRLAAFAMSYMLLAMTIIVLIFWTNRSEGDKSIYADSYVTLFLSSVCVVFLLFFLIIVVSYLDRLKKHRMEKEKIQIYEDLALKDGMTGLMNRRAFEKRLNAFDENPGDNPDATLVILDLNGLKKINDEQGHAVGDEAIVAVANAIHEVYDIHGESFRIGGDEFAAIIKDLSVDVRALNKQFDAALDKYNHVAHIPIAVAKGSCNLYDGMGRRFNTVEWKQNADINMYLDKKQSRSGDAVKRAQDLQSILDTVIELVEAKDQYTANHSERVRDLSVRIAGWLNLSPETIEQIDLAAHLHDIGKVGIPENILLKPARLTDEEFAEMKKHPEIGAKVIRRANNLEEVAAIVLHHHERYDGKGYPEGIAGEEIPLGARVVALADSIDAMTSKRCYRDSLGIDVCRDEIERNLSKMYDPVIGRIVLEHWQEIREMVLRG